MLSLNLNISKIYFASVLQEFNVYIFLSIGKRKRRQSKASDKNQTPSWRTIKNVEPTQGQIFDPSAASLRKNKEYLELKREIALKGKPVNLSNALKIGIFNNRRTHNMYKL